MLRTMKKFFILCFALAFSSLAQSMEVSTGNVQVNGQQLTVKLFDDPAVNPVCRQKFNTAKQAMFYLSGNTFAHGCWIPLDGEIHTQMTRYDTNETRAYVFSQSIFKANSAYSSIPGPPPRVSAEISRPETDLNAPRPSWCKNSKLPHEVGICADENLSKNELDILELYSEFARSSGLSLEQLRAHRVEFFKKVKACGSNKSCILSQQTERMQWYRTYPNGKSAAQLEQKGPVSEQAEVVAKNMAHLGLPKIQTKGDFIAYFGACGEDASTKQMSAEALRGAAFTCVARDSIKCARDVRVGACKLIRFAFDRNEATTWAFLSLGGSRAETRAADIYQPIYGRQEPKASQSNGYAKFDFAWSLSNLRIELTNLVDISDVNGLNNLSLVWVVSK